MAAKLNKLIAQFSEMSDIAEDRKDYELSEIMDECILEMGDLLLALRQ